MASHPPSWKASHTVSEGAPGSGSPGPPDHHVPALAHDREDVWPRS
jgi:hypothetical protein